MPKLFPRRTIVVPMLTIASVHQDVDTSETLGDPAASLRTLATAPIRPLQAPDQPSGWLPLAQAKQAPRACLGDEPDPNDGWSRQLLRCERGTQIARRRRYR
jgi:hypothetical protein